MFFMFIIITIIIFWMVFFMFIINMKWSSNASENLRICNLVVWRYKKPIHQTDWRLRFHWMQIRIIFRRKIALSLFFMFLVSVFNLFPGDAHLSLLDFLMDSLLLFWAQQIIFLYLESLYYHITCRIKTSLCFPLPRNLTEKNSL